MIHLFVSGTDDAYGVNRDQDIAVTGHFAAVDDGVGQAGVGRQHHALAQDHSDFDVSEGSDAAGPRAGRVDNEVGVDV